MDTNSIRTAMEKTLATSVIPKGHKGAFVVAFEDSILRTAVATRVGDNWEITGVIGYHAEGNKKLSGKVEIKATW